VDERRTVVAGRRWESHWEVLAAGDFFLSIAFVVVFPDIVLWLPKLLVPESRSSARRESSRRSRTPDSTLG
jgi:hypothetical protein